MYIRLLRMLVPMYACTYVVYHLLKTKQSCDKEDWAAKQMWKEFAALSPAAQPGHSPPDYSANDCTETLPNMELQNTPGACA